MIVAITWPNRDHPLLQTAQFEVIEDGNPIPTVVGPGRVSALVSDVAVDLRFTITFTATISGHAAEVLRVEQGFHNSGVGAPGQPAFEPVDYSVLTGPTRLRRRIPGMHPLLRGNALRLTALTSIIDVTATVPEFTSRLSAMAPRAAGVDAKSSPRLFARTDGVQPELWIITAPHVCRGATATDVLCFLGPQQNHGVPPPLLTQLGDAAAISALTGYAAVLLGTGTPSGGGVGDPHLMDHFTPGNFILAKGYEAALVASARHALLAIPVPANRSHNAAATDALPGLLADVHRLAVAVGDAHPPLAPGDLELTATPTAAPRYGVAVHSRGALGLYGESNKLKGALTAGPDAYSDLLLFEGLGTGTSLHKLARTRSTKIAFIGYAANVVSGPHRAALDMPALGPARVQRLPIPSTVPGELPPESAPLTQLAAHSPSLLRALAPLASPPTTSEDLFMLKHQLCTWSGDDQGVTGNPEQHFLTQALLMSTLR